MNLIVSMLLIEGLKDGEPQVLKWQSDQNVGEETAPHEALNSALALAVVVETRVVRRNLSTEGLSDARAIPISQDSNEPNENPEEKEAHRDALEDVGDLSGGSVVLPHKEPNVGSEEDWSAYDAPPVQDAELANEADALKHHVGNDAANKRAAAAARSWLLVCVHEQLHTSVELLSYQL